MPPKRKAAASEKTSTRAEGGTNGNVVSSEATTAVTPTKRSRRGSDVSSEKLSESPPNIQETKQQPKRGRGRPVKARPKNKNNGETTSGRLNESGEKMDYEVSPQSPGSSSEEVASEKSNSPGKTKINESNKGEEKQQLKSEPMETDEDGDNKTEKLAKEQPQDKLKMLQTQEKPAELVAENTVPVSSGDIKEHQKQEKSDGGDTSRAKSDEQRQQEEKSTANQKSEDTDNKKFSNEQKKMDFIHDMPSNVLEKGHISFFYRPKIAAMHPNNPNEVQRLYIMLIPTLIRPTLGDKPIETVAQKMVKGKKTDEKEEGKLIGKPRLLIVGKKKLPEVENHARYWTFVDKSFDNLDDIKSTLGMEHYSTKTRGERTLQPCRPLGRGAYSILEHNKHTHLAYVLELPSQPGEVQSAFNIKHEASYIITVKNPEASNPPSAGLTSNKKSSYPPELMAKFEGRRFAPLYTTEFLDYEDSELILVGTKEDIKGELGAPGEYLENWADDEAKEIQLLEDRAIFEELHLEPKDFPHETLKGIWE
ncbi:10734_t:CDS:2 [Ambispora gerdemannii]|uniref:10734_t:CDS:1 n=1 Tax=Ambispora gerdemannii TaxID=144530 RepID=A0A9N9AA10_9GLOM|nr:10734_t:CDS:2 [Ambispora gerdemannii]